AGPRLPGAERLQAELGDQALRQQQGRRAGVHEGVGHFHAANLVRLQQPFADAEQVVQVLDLRRHDHLPHRRGPHGVPPACFATSYGFRGGTVQMRTVWSQLLLTSRRPSGLKATRMAILVWPSKVVRTAPVLGSHNLTLWSSPALARTLPSGLNVRP